MKKSQFFFAIVYLIFSCSDGSKEKFPENIFAIEQIGKLKNGSYTFCSTVPKKIEYTYRVGGWSFYMKNGKKIAEGEYDKKIIEIDSAGGCSYSYITNSVNLNKWKFWDIDGKEIQPTTRLISLINLK